MRKEQFQIPNISCVHCTMAIENELKELSGIIRVSGDVDAKTVVVTWETPATRDQIIATLKEINYPALV